MMHYALAIRIWFGVRNAEWIASMKESNAKTVTGVDDCGGGVSFLLRPPIALYYYWAGLPQPLQGPCRIPTENTVENYFKKENKSIDLTKKLDCGC